MSLGASKQEPAGRAAVQNQPPPNAPMRVYVLSTILPTSNTESYEKLPAQRAREFCGSGGLCLFGEKHTTAYNDEKDRVRVYQAALDRYVVKARGEFSTTEQQDWITRNARGAITTDILNDSIYTPFALLGYIPAGGNENFATFVIYETEDSPPVIQVLQRIHFLKLPDNGIFDANSANDPNNPPIEIPLAITLHPIKRNSTIETQVQVRAEIPAALKDTLADSTTGRIGDLAPEELISSSNSSSDQKNSSPAQEQPKPNKVSPATARPAKVEIKVDRQIETIMARAAQIDAVLAHARRAMQANSRKTLRSAPNRQKLSLIVAGINHSLIKLNSIIKRLEKILGFVKKHEVAALIGKLKNLKHRVGLVDYEANDDIDRVDFKKLERVAHILNELTIEDYEVIKAIFNSGMDIVKEQKLDQDLAQSSSHSLKTNNLNSPRPHQPPSSPVQAGSPREEEGFLRRNIIAANLLPGVEFAQPKLEEGELKGCVRYGSFDEKWDPWASPQRDQKEQHPVYLLGKLMADRQQLFVEQVRYQRTWDTLLTIEQTNDIRGKVGAKLPDDKRDDEKDHKKPAVTKGENYLRELSFKEPNSILPLHSYVNYEDWRNLYAPMRVRCSTSSPYFELLDDLLREYHCHRFTWDLETRFKRANEILKLMGHCKSVVISTNLYDGEPWKQLQKNLREELELVKACTALTLDKHLTYPATTIAAPAPAALPAPKAQPSSWATKIGRGLIRFFLVAGCAVGGFFALGPVGAVVGAGLGFACAESLNTYRQARAQEQAKAALQQEKEDIKKACLPVETGYIFPTPSEIGAMRQALIPVVPPTPRAHRIVATPRAMTSSSVTSPRMAPVPEEEKFSTPPAAPATMQPITNSSGSAPSTNLTLTVLSPRSPTSPIGLCSPSGAAHSPGFVTPPSTRPLSPQVVAETAAAAGAAHNLHTAITEADTSDDESDEKLGPQPAQTQQLATEKSKKSLYEKFGFLNNQLPGISAEAANIPVNAPQCIIL